MRYILSFVALLTVAIATQALGQSLPIEVYYSPKGGCTEACVRELNSARSSVLVQAYSFTSAPIAKALIDAAKRGVHVEVILDKSNLTDKYSAADFVHNMGIPTRIDKQHAIAHNKIMIIDGQTVVTGSFNFTKQAETSNGENLLVIHDAGLSAKYTANWQLHAAHSEVYNGKGAEEPKTASKSRKKAA